MMAQVETAGYVQTETRLFLQKNYRFYWNENRLNLKISAVPADGANIYSEFWIRSFGFPEVSNSSDLMRQEKDKVTPWSILFREAYLDLYGFLTPDLDIRIGLQRIAWGTADKFNPTDNLNPDDLEDIWDFGRHLGSNAIKANYYLGNYTLTAVLIPIFVPATIPIADWSSAFSPPLSLPPGFTLRNIDDKVVTPESNLKESSMFGFKVAKNFWGYDLSLSYFYGRDDIPIANSVVLTPVDTLGMVDVSLEFMYPRIQVLGLDMAGAIGNVGIWAEGAIFFPQKVDMYTYLTNMGVELQKFNALDSKPYVKYVIGIDYTFKNNWYINWQYLHGFIHERGEGMLGDYFVFALEKRLLRNRVKIIPIGGGIEIRDFSDLKNNNALILGPQLSYFPFDNTEINLGFRLLEGKDSTTFGSVKDNDELYLKVIYSF
jgi:hypothetical protein